MINQHTRIDLVALRSTKISAMNPPKRHRILTTGFDLPAYSRPRNCKTWALVRRSRTGR
jgi:hypothetical protein